MMKIGEAARLANISKRTLYYYEEIGILVPERINTYRYYSEKDYIKLQQILLLKSIGYSIIQIVEFFKSTDSFNDDDLLRLSPYSKTQQKYAQKIHDYSMLLFEGDVMLMNKYWEMITPTDDTSSKVLGIDKTFMDYINKMMDYFENNKLNK